MKYLKTFLITLFLCLASLFSFSYIPHVEAVAETTKFQTESPTDNLKRSDLTQKIDLGANATFSDFVEKFIVRLGEIAIRVLIALSLLTFLWGVAKSIFKGQSSDTARLEGRKLMLWGIIGLFVMTSVWGLVSILSGVLGVETLGTPQFKVSKP